MVAPRTYDFPSRDEHPLRADVYLPPGQPHALVVICHGFKGHRRWGFIPQLARSMVERGLAALAMDFSHNGTITDKPGQGAREGSFAHNPYVRIDLFRRNTLSREVEDLGCLLEDLTSDGPFRWRGPLGLFGHSRAGVSVVLNALEHPQVRSIATWAAPVHPDVFSEEQKRRWREVGYLEFVDARNGARLAIDLEYLLDLERNHDRFHLPSQVPKLTVPHLIVHGTMDLSIRPEAARALYEAEKGKVKSKLVLLPCGHTFQSDAIGTGRARALEEACRITADWFASTLEEGRDQP